MLKSHMSGKLGHNYNSEAYIIIPRLKWRLYFCIYLTCVCLYICFAAYHYLPHPCILTFCKLLCVFPPLCRYFESVKLLFLKTCQHQIFYVKFLYAWKDWQYYFFYNNHVLVLYFHYCRVNLIQIEKSNWKMTKQKKKLFDVIHILQHLKKTIRIQVLIYLQ